MVGCTSFEVRKHDVKWKERQDAFESAVERVRVERGHEGHHAYVT